jgi:hypothetical protein
MYIVIRWLNYVEKIPEAEKENALNLGIASSIQT